MRAAVVVAAVALVLAGCSGDSSSDGTVSVDDFCATFNGMVEDVLTSDDESGSTAQVIKDAAERLDDIGAPEDMPEDAKRGVELFIENAADVQEDMGLEDLQRLGAGDTAQQRADREALATWVGKNCPMTTK